MNRITSYQHIVTIHINICDVLNLNTLQGCINTFYMLKNVNLIIIYSLTDLYAANFMKYKQLVD